MYSVAYVSDQRTPFDTEALLALGELCSARNYEKAVTGYLSWRDGSFFQYLEGEEATVRALMTSIVADERHTVVRLLELGEWSDRQFADWDMCFLDPPESSRARILAEVDRLVRTLSAPTLAGKEDAGPIARMVERVARLVRENDPA